MEVDVLLGCTSKTVCGNTFIKVFPLIFGVWKSVLISVEMF